MGWTLPWRSPGAAVLLGAGILTLSVTLVARGQAGEPHIALDADAVAQKLIAEATKLEAARRNDEALVRWIGVRTLDPGNGDALRAIGRLAEPGAPTSAVILQERLSQITLRLDQFDTRLANLDSSLALQQRAIGDLEARFVAVDRALNNDGRAEPITDRLGASIVALERSVQNLQGQLLGMDRDIADLRRRVR